MSKNSKIFSLFAVTAIFFMISLLTYYNDEKNYTILFSTLAILSLGYMIYIIFHKTDKKAVYNKKIKKIMKIYNSKLVRINEDYEFSNENIVNAKNLEDIFNLSEEFEKPIVYLEESDSCVFFLQYGEDVLYYVLKQDENKETKFEIALKSYKERNKNNEKEILSNINKTTIIQMKNNKFYKIKPVKK